MAPQKLGKRGVGVEMGVRGCALLWKGEGTIRGWHPYKDCLP